MISIVCCVLLFPVVFAFNVSMYSGIDYFSPTRDLKPVLLDKNKLYGFEYHSDEDLHMDIVLNNKAPNIFGTFYVTSRATPNDTGDDMIVKHTTLCREGDCLNIRTKLKSPFIYIGMQLYRGTVLYATQIISEGRATSTSTHANLCVKPRNCVMVIDLQNECDKDIIDPKGQSTSTLSQNNVYIYVIPSVIVMCVVVLGIYLTVKKCRNRSTDPETLELNTYATKNEVLYADLSFVQGNIQPPRHEEESPYAEIMGVMRPS